MLDVFSGAIFRSPRTAKIFFALLLAWSAPMRVRALEEIEVPVVKNGADKDKPKVDKNAKPSGPEHNVSLPEEPGANDLFNRAKKARARAEKDPESWPECVKCYADILKKYPNSVYLERWEGPEKTDLSYKNGLYRSTRERVAAELATLPPSALAVYRVINDPPARALFLESQQQLDERKMEQDARDYFLTSWGDNALAWLGEVAAERGSPRESLARFKQAAGRPTTLAPPVAVLARTLLQQLKIADKAGADKTLEALAAAMRDPQQGTLRVAHDDGAAAFEKLKARVAALPAASAAATPAARDEDSSKWETYFGNASHNKQAQPRPGAGLRTWSAQIDDLLYGKGVVSKEAAPVVQVDDGLGIAVPDPSMNQQLTISNGVFYLNDSQVYAAYPTSDPRPGALAAQGNALFQLPVEGQKSPPNRHAANTANNQRNGAFVAQPPIVQHPYFGTLANGNVYGVLGLESPAVTPMDRANGVRFIRGGRQVTDEDAHGPSNYLACIGRKENGGEYTVLWSLKPGDPCFNLQSKADQEWLKAVYFVSSPTYDSGVLYAMAVQISSSTLDAFGAAFDASSGRMLWHTQICSGQPLLYTSRVQPDRGLPVAVANRAVYVVTNLGAVASLDAGSGALKWIRVYDRVKTSPNNMWGMGDMAMGRDFWAPNPPLVYENRLIVTPQDSEMIYAYDTETGARSWEFSRYKNENPRPEERGLKHVLGIVNGTVVLSGEDLRFISVKHGRREPEPLYPESPIRGRGTVTTERIFYSTDKGLTGITVMPAPVQGAPLVLGKSELFPWTDSKEEAGSVYAADGVLYTVSHTHINAYIVWQELEARLKERLKAQPADVDTLMKLANVYKSIGRYDTALAQVDAAMAAAAQRDPGRIQETLAEFNSRRFELLLLLGGSLAADQKTSAALERYKEAVALSAMKGLPPVLAVSALKAQAELLEKNNDLPAAAQAYQELLEKHGDVVYQFQPQSSLKAGLFARTRLNALLAKNPGAYAKIDEQAKFAFEQAGKDPQKLDEVVKRFPNSSSAAAALLLQARTELPKAPDRARLSALRYLNRRNLGQANNAAGAAEALKIYAVACDHLNLTAAAREAFTKLATEPEYKGVQLHMGPLEGEADHVIVISDWARDYLQDARFKRAPGQSVFSMGSGDGAGKLKFAWARPSTDSAAIVPLLPEGVPPVEMRRAVLSIEGGTELMALAGRDGKELWKPRPAAPANSSGRAFWWERLLIVSGEKTLSAYDSADNGTVAWKIELNLDTSVNAIDWVQLAGGRVVVAHSGSVLEAFDASSGGALWRTQLEGGPLTQPPAFGENFAALVLNNSHKLAVYDLDTGAERWNETIDNICTAPCVHEEKIFAARLGGSILGFDARTGKKICENMDTSPKSPIAARGTPTMLCANGEYVFALIGKKEVAAFRYDAKNSGKEWMVSGTADNNAALYNITQFLVDGDELLVAGVLANTKAELASYSIRRQGTLNWKRDIAIMRSDATVENNPNMQVVMAGGQRMIIQNGMVVPAAPASTTAAPRFEMPANWLRENAARDHVLVLQSGWDVGSTARVAVLVDRGTGKAVWDAELKAEQTPDGSYQRARMQLFEGGVVLLEARGRTAYAAPGAAGEEAELNALAEHVAKNPQDFTALARLAAANYERGSKETALGALVEMLGNDKLDNLQFASVYNQYARLRGDFARKIHPALKFQRVETKPDMRPGSVGWEELAEQPFGGWKNIFLASEDTTSRVQPKKEAWHGPADLKASFKGAYDDKNLYIEIIATDDRHANNQTDAARIDFGDALTLAFDVNLAGGVGYRDECFELALGLDKTGKAQSVRRVEHGRYLHGVQTLGNVYSVTREEDKHLTVYKLMLPLVYLGLKDEPGKTFGFNFALHDQDAGNDVDKTLSPGSGLAGTRQPGLFPHAVLEAKK